MDKIFEIKTGCISCGSIKKLSNFSNIRVYVKINNKVVISQRISLICFKCSKKLINNLNKKSEQVLFEIFLPKKYKKYKHQRTL